MAQADASWGAVRRSPYLVRSPTRTGQDTEAGQRSGKAKVAIALARLRLLKQRFETERERYVDRAEAVAVGEQEANYVLEGTAHGDGFVEGDKPVHYLISMINLISAPSRRASRAGTPRGRPCAAAGRIHSPAWPRPTQRARAG